MRILCVILLAAAGGWTRPLEPASSAEFCGKCHRAILDAWKSSAHAKAMESALFQEGLELTRTAFGAAGERACLSCHAPMVALVKDTSLRQKVSWEGVTCDYCHSLRSVSLGQGNPVANIELSLEKSGPIQVEASPAHKTRYSPVHSSSLVCAPCHEYRNALGLAVLTTYSEWQRSRYAKEKRECQSCHMYAVAGPVAAPAVARPSGATVNLHQMPGSHSIDQLNKTIKAQLSTEWEGGNLKVIVQVANTAAGHYVPTGSPMRQLTLEVTADPYGGRQFREVRIYHRTLVDKQGKAVTLEPYAFLAGAKVTSDNRLAPDEKRTETFTFPIPEGTRTQVQATFGYYYSPLARSESQKRVTFLSLRRLVK